MIIIQYHDWFFENCKISQNKFYRNMHMQKLPVAAETKNVH